MDINNVFPSNYLKAGELLADTVFTIKKITVEELGSGEQKESKPIIYFNESDKGLACNKTNANTIANLYGPETDNWIGQKITLFAQEVDFQGKQVLAIRVRMRKPSVAPVGNGTHDPSISNAKREGWERWKTGRAGTVDELVAGMKLAISKYFPGQTPDTLSARQWSELVTNNFSKPDVPSPITDAVVFDDPDSIPF